jgi:hypothetical protein
MEQLKNRDTEIMINSLLNSKAEHWLYAIAIVLAGLCVMFTFKYIKKNITNKK